MKISKILTAAGLSCIALGTLIIGILYFYYGKSGYGAVALLYDTNYFPGAMVLIIIGLPAVYIPKALTAWKEFIKEITTS